MRSRRQFQPTFDLMPSRIAPSNLAGVPCPMDPSSNPGASRPTIGNPMDPSYNPNPTPTSTHSPTIGPGSYTPVQITPTAPMIC